jgi:Lipase (class 3)
MLQAARALHQDVEALVRAELEAHPQYSLVLVGHSSGGGVASLLSILWQDLFGEHRLGAVYLYGAPCVAPLDARPTGTNGNSTNDKIMSVVMHGDPFGRLSLGHVADVSIDLAHLCDNEGLRRVIFLHTDGKTRDLDKSDLQWCAATMQELRQRRRRTASSNICAGTWTTKATPNADAAATEAMTLYPPGRILYLSHETNIETHAPGRRLRHGRHSKRRTTIVRQVPPEFLQDLIISPSMFDLSKHVPALYESSLRTAAIHAR